MKTNLLRWVAGGLALGAFVVPVPAQYTIVNVIPTDRSTETEQNSEPSIAINPNNPKQTIIGSFGDFGTPQPIFVCADPVSSAPAAKWRYLEGIPHGDQTFDWSLSGIAYGSILSNPNVGDISLVKSANPTGIPGVKFNPSVTSLYRKFSISGGKQSTLTDQPWIVVARAGMTDRIYIPFNDLSSPSATAPNATASILFSLDSGNTWRTNLLEGINPPNLLPLTFGQDSPAVRVAVAGDRVYAVFERWTALGPNRLNHFAQIVVVRDDNAGLGNGAGQFAAIGGTNGINVTASYSSNAVMTPWTSRNGGAKLGHERLGSNVAIGGDPRNSDVLYVAFVQLEGPTNALVPTVRVAYSTDGALSWTQVFRGPNGSALPALAVGTNGTVGLLYTALNGVNLETHFVQASSGFAPVLSDDVLSTFPDNNPVQDFDPYIGDYENVKPAGSNFCGTFSASGEPDPAHFPSGLPIFDRWFKNSLTGATNSTYLPANGVNQLADTNGRALTTNWFQVADSSTNGLDVLATTNLWLADDFRCTATGPITQVKIWGSWNSNLVATAPTFILRIFDDKPAGGGNPSEPGANVLWGSIFPAGTYITNVYAAGVNEKFYDPRTAGTNGIMGTDTVIWQYTFNIPKGFTQTSGNTYWLSVQVDNTQTNRFGWKTCPTNWNDTAVFNRLDATGWHQVARPDSTNAIGFAFALGMGPVPSIDPYYFATLVKSNQNTTWSQLPSYLISTNGARGEDRESDLDLDNPPSRNVVADDFVYQGSQVRRVRWWGSYLMGQDYPVEDGYLLSFFLDNPAVGTNGSSPANLLSTYIAPIQKVRVCTTGYTGCDGTPIYQYEVDLKDTCTNYLLAGYGNANGFIGNSNSVYWLSIAAYAGGTLNTNTCMLVTNGNARTTSIHFWGWHTSPVRNNDLSVKGRLEVTNNPWIYSSWSSNGPAVCATQEVDQAFVLYNDPGNVAPPLTFSTNTLPNLQWVQRPNLTTFGMDVLASDGSPAPIAADDFRSTSSGALVGFHVWGSWLNDQFDPNARFRIALWQDVPAANTTNGLSHPGTRLWLATFTNGPAGAPFSYSVSVEASGINWERFFDPAHPAFAGTDTTVYRYDFYVPTNSAYYQVSNTISWLSVNALTTNVFGWKTAVTNDHNLDSAVWSQVNAPAANQWSSLFYPSNHLYSPAAVDLAFGVRSVFVPPPLPPITNIVVVGKWLQVPDTSPNGLDVRATMPKILADDFLCTTSGPVTKIEIWGSWLNDINDAIPQFCLGIWSDVPAAGGNPSHPGALLWNSCFVHGDYRYEPVAQGPEQFFDPNLGVIIGSDSNIWHYTFPVALANAFHQTNGTVYWLSVAAQVSDTNFFLFGWKTCPTNWNDNAVFNDFDAFGNFTGPWQELIRPGTTNGLNLSFALSTTTITTNTPLPPPPPYIPTNYLVQWPQTPAYLRTTTPSGTDRASDFTWGTLGPWPMVADDFQADGRAILGLRWWGSYLNGYSPSIVDGFVVSFFSDIQPSGGEEDNPTVQTDGGIGDAGQPGTLLGTYIVPSASVHATDTGAAGADGQEIYQYQASLSDACLYLPGPATLPGSFQTVADTTYWISIQAEAGWQAYKTTDFYGAPTCNSTTTTNQPDSDFWGWHTSPCQQLAPSGSASFDNFDTDWQYYDWMDNSPEFGEIDQAFETLVDSTIAPPAPISTSLTGLTWLQRPDLTPQGLAMLATAGQNSALVADDFAVATGEPLTSIKIWGAWLDDQLDANAVFTLRIWSSAPASVLPGVPLWQGSFTNIVNYQVFPEGPTICNEPFFDPSTNNLVGSDSQVYRYEFFTPAAQAFDPLPGTVYWLSVTVINTTNSFGWKTAAPYDHYNANAAWKASSLALTWSSLLYPPSHPYVGRATNTLDMAFALTTGCTNLTPPNPSSTLRDDGSVLISWPDTGDCFYVLQTTPQLTPPVTWTSVPLTTPTSLVLTPTNSAMFFRLYKP